MPRSELPYRDTYWEPRGNGRHAGEGLQSPAVLLRGPKQTSERALRCASLCLLVLACAMQYVNRSEFNWSGQMEPVLFQQICGL